MSSELRLEVFSIRVDDLKTGIDESSAAPAIQRRYLSPNAKVVEQAKAAHIKDMATAQTFSAAVAVDLRKSLGEQAVLVVERWDLAATKAELARLEARARHDTSVVRARLRERNFVPNSAPLIVASDLR